MAVAVLRPLVLAALSLDEEPDRELQEAKANVAKHKAMILNLFIVVVV